MTSRSIRAAFTIALLSLAACSSSYRVGDRVLVEWEGTDFPANVVAVESPGKYKVHFEGYDVVWDEAVAATRIHGKVHGTPPNPPPPPKVRARSSGGKQSQSKWKVGEKVKCEWKGSFYPAEIKAVLGGEKYRVRYDGYDQNWDENVDVQRIQRRLAIVRFSLCPRGISRSLRHSDRSPRERC